MKIEDSEILNRYLHEVTRYMSYDTSNEAKEDIRKLVEEELGTNPSEIDIKNYIKHLGNPYSISSQYEVKSNILISGRNYEIYIRFLKVLSIVMICANLISWIKGYYVDVKFYDFLQIIVSQMLTIFVSLTISFFIAEKIKNTRMIASVMKDFDVSKLYEKRKYKPVKPLVEILVIAYSLVIFIAMTPLMLNEAKELYRLLQLIFFLNILRDVNKISESSYRRVVVFLMIISDTIAILISISLLKKDIIIDNILIRSIVILLISSIWDLLSGLSEIVLSKKRSKNKPF